MREKFERSIEAYRDGALSRPKRERLERRLRQDREGERHLRRTRALGSIVRETWNDGPAAPSPEYVMAALRPAMAAIDAERRAAPGWARALGRVASWVNPIPAALVTAAAAIALFILLPTTTPQAPDSAPAGALSASSEPAAPGIEAVAFSRMPAVFENGVARNVGFPHSIYDLAQGERPLMLFEADDGATVIWLLADAESPGDLPDVEAWG